MSTADALPPPLGPSPGTPLGLSAGGADLAEALRGPERRWRRAGHGDTWGAIAAPGVAREGQ